jgi:glycerol-3-phosphate dehydrogenase
MALKLSDIVFRRTSLAQAGCPPREGLQKVAEIMARELGWDEIRRKREIEEIFRACQPLKEKG